MLASDVFIDIGCTIRPNGHAIFTSFSFGVLPRIVENFVAKVCRAAKVILEGLAFHLAHATCPVPRFVISPVVRASVVIFAVIKPRIAVPATHRHVLKAFFTSLLRMWVGRDPRLHVWRAFVQTSVHLEVSAAFW